MRSLQNKGLAVSQIILASMYYEGQGTPKNYKKALYWLEKSAKQGHARPQYRLGIMYYEGQGTPKNYKKALYWYEKAANKGHAISQYILADGCIIREKEFPKIIKRHFIGLKSLQNKGMLDLNIGLG